MKQSLISFWKESKLIISKKLLEAFEKVPREDLDPVVMIGFSGSDGFKNLQPYLTV